MERCENDDVGSQLLHATVVVVTFVTTGVVDVAGRARPDRQDEHG
jgi:hypothetical protein